MIKNATLKIDIDEKDKSLCGYNCTWKQVSPYFHVSSRVPDICTLFKNQSLWKATTVGELMFPLDNKTKRCKMCIEMGE